MASCEKCWGDAYMRTLSDPLKSQAEHYSDLIHEREENPCTPEEQAGQEAKKCPECGRFSVHEICHVCMNCGWKNK